MITVPASFAGQFRSDAGRAWLAGLPDLAERYLTRWSLRPDGAPMHGFAALVLPVHRADGTPAVLKLSLPHDEAADEAIALLTWDGAGTVRVLAHDDFVLLLERLDPDHSLDHEPIDDAVTVAAGLLRRSCVPAPVLRRNLPDLAARWAGEFGTEAAGLGDPVPRPALDRAVGLCRELGPSAGSTLVNEDLHYQNVLRGRRERWLVIDPKPLAGDPEFGVVPLLWNRFRSPEDTLRRFDRIVGAAGLDPERARAWTFVRAVDNWLWALGEGYPEWAGIYAAIADVLERFRTVT